MFRPLADRKEFMARYFDVVMRGYGQENTLSDAWLDQLPFFIKVLEMEDVLYWVRYLDDPDPETRSLLRFKLHCIENDIPYLGYFCGAYSPERPFML